MSERDELAELLSKHEDCAFSASGVIVCSCGTAMQPQEAQWDLANLASHQSEVLHSHGYRKVERVTEYGTVFNRRAIFLMPPAETIEEFKERYERELGWMLTERDPILTRTFLRCDLEPTEPVLHAAGEGA